MLTEREIPLPLRGRQSQQLPFSKPWLNPASYLPVLGREIRSPRWRGALPYPGAQASGRGSAVSEEGSGCTACCYSDTRQDGSVSHLHVPRGLDPAHFNTENIKGLTNQNNPQYNSNPLYLPGSSGQNTRPRAGLGGHSSSRGVFATIMSLDSSKRNLPSL